MSITPFDPKKLIELDFVVRKVGWSLYDVESDNVKGTIRVLGFPTNILEVPSEMLPPGAPRPAVLLAVQGIVGFKNEGSKGEPGQPLTPQELQNLPKEDLTSLVSTRDEPFNEFVASRKGQKALLVRTKTSLLKFELFKDKFGPAGDPVVWINHNTAHSVSELNTGDIYSA